MPDKNSLDMLGISNVLKTHSKEIKKEVKKAKKK